MTPMLAFNRKISRLRHVKNDGFTLLEILLVLMIIGLASVLIFPNVGGSRVQNFQRAGTPSSIAAQFR
mgnify:CR=1 FL=1